MNAILMQSGKSSFADENGQPLISGTVTFYSVGTNTLKDTWRDTAKTVKNTNPVILDARGEASIYGDGAYRQVLRDALGNLIWDQIVPDLLGSISDAIQSIFQTSSVQVDSVAKLRQLSKLTTKNAETRGYRTPGDGGFGRYYLDTTDVVTADNGGTVIVAADGGRWKLVNPNDFNVRQFGATGDGTTDDTQAFVKALTFACATLNTTVRIPSGLYRVAGNVPLSGAVSQRIKVSIIGEGTSTEIYHTGDMPLFQASGMIFDFSARDFTVRNKRSTGNAENGVFSFPDGNCNSDFENLRYLPDTVTNVAGTSFYLCGVGKLNDSINFTNLYCFVDWIGLRIGRGSSVFIIGGRVASSFPAVLTAVGLWLTGGMGGVWVMGTDFIGLGTGVRLTQDSGTTNRELFLMSGCTDSCAQGLSIEDSSSYVSWTGCWASSCSIANINFAPTSNQAELNIAGGTIFNAGANDPSAQSANNGIAINEFGRVEISGVSIRNNKGRGISCNSATKAAPTSFTGCKIYANGTSGRSGSFQAFLAGNVSFVNNEVDTPLGANISVDASSSRLMDIRDNRGYRGIDLRPGPAIGATGVDVTNNSGQQVIGYFRGGNVASYWINGIQVSAATLSIQLTLNPGDSFRVVYSAAPTVTWYFS